VHRDLKPGNIMLTKSGAKLLDFGLAKSLQKIDAVSLGVSTLDTEAKNLTAAGTIVGTFQYMAPEQLEGKETDSRIDIFALGTTLYEMATGKKAFTGNSQASLIASILSSEPAPISTIEPMNPPALDRVVKKCLAKDPDDRWQSANDLASELKWISEGASQTAVTAIAPRSRKWERFWMFATLACLVLIAAMALSRFRQPVPTPRPIKVSVLPPQNRILGSSLAVSPDGNSLAFVASRPDGKSSLWIRPLDSLLARELPGTQDAVWPFWSPDSQFIGFFANGKLKKINASGEPLQIICDVSWLPRGGTWSQDGTILFAPSTNEGLYRVSSAGGVPAPVTELDTTRGEATHRFPQFLPDGRHFIYWLRCGQPEITGIYLGSLDSKEKKQLVVSDRLAIFSSPGYLLSGKEGTLVAQPFDIKKMQLSGEPFPVAEHVLADPYAIGTTIFSASETGVLAFRSGSLSSRLVWLDRNKIATIGKEEQYLNVNTPPDFRRFAVKFPNPGDVWLMELTDGTRSRFTFDQADDAGPIWSPDGSRILFSSSQLGPFNLYQKASNGAGAEELLLKTNYFDFPTDWSPDGKWIMYEELSSKTKTDLWLLPMTGERKPVLFLQTQANESQAKFSPDGRWVAYVSDESGNPEVYVRSLPTSGGGKWQISTDGGYQPKWKQDGNELFFISGNRKLMSLNVKTGTTFEVSGSKELFEMQIPTLITRSAVSFSNDYAVSPDGQKFLVITPVEDTSSLPITVVFNWTALLKH
jgi:eukaryotic-like serine/threonine-protein kinase